MVGGAFGADAGEAGGEGAEGAGAEGAEQGGQAQLLEGPQSDVFDADGAGAFGAEGIGVNAEEVGGVGAGGAVGRGAVEVEQLAGEEVGATEEVGGDGAGRGERTGGGEGLDELAEQGPVRGGDVEAGPEVEEGLLTGASMDADGADEAEVGLGGAVGRAAVGGATDEHKGKLAGRGVGSPGKSASRFIFGLYIIQSLLIRRFGRETQYLPNKTQSFHDPISTCAESGKSR